jgi:hypothetical protein
MEADGHGEEVCSVGEGAELRVGDRRLVVRQSEQVALALASEGCLDLGGGLRAEGGRRRDCPVAKSPKRRHGHDARRCDRDDDER